MTELSTRFQFKDIEDKWIKHWIDHDLFHAKADSGKKPYTIVIPPPNVTGILHMGHALNNTLQDIIIRYKRMNGFAACWMPGTDHAGIATQNVVEKQLAKEGKTRHDVGREKLLERLWAWKQEYGDTIINQLKKIGASCDWSRTRFTMDDEYSNAVKEVFLRLYKKGLVYRGEYIINWCPRCRTALSDEEAEHHETEGGLYHFRYPLKNDPKKYIVVATTRPETMLGDTAVAVHPEDDRYKDMIGQSLILPIMNREIPIIADDFVDPEFGTGAVKVTPAHDPNDFQMGRRHDLEIICVMNEDGTLNDRAGDFNGQDRFEAREAIVETFKELKLFEKSDPHTHAVGHCYRCHTVVEPYISKQWFVKMEPLAKPAIKVVKDKTVTFTPDRWTKVYLNWMENIRDWCISRQIWWGHRIPVWYDEAGNEYAARDEKDALEQARAKIGKDAALKQDEDVLDTWFSSWLWPFATFGWPNEDEASKRDVEFFYPGNSLFTASEIIFFWVARMVMAGIEFRNDVPFTDVFIHGTVRDEQGRKMSKSLGNALDPLEIIEEYGADALRFSLIMNSGQDLYISKDKFEIGRNFANKIWNASRLVLMNITIKDRRIDLLRDLDVKGLDLPSRWIISRFYATLRDVSKAIEVYKYSEAENLIYEFFWNHYCDWYLEISKNRFNDEVTQKVALGILEKAIRMMNPFIPFVTEEIWQHLGISDKTLAEESWPEQQDELIDTQADEAMNLISSAISTIRNLKVQWNIPPHQKVQCLAAPLSDFAKETLNSNQDILIKIGRLEKLTLVEELPKQKDIVAGIIDGLKIGIPLGNLVDVDKEIQRLKKQIETMSRDQKSLSGRLSNEKFLAKAPKNVVQKEKERLSSLDTKILELSAVLNGLGQN